MVNTVSTASTSDQYYGVTVPPDDSGMQDYIDAISPSVLCLLLSLLLMVVIVLLGWRR